MNREFRNLRTGIKDLAKERKNQFPAILGNKAGVVIVSGNIVNILTIPEGIPLQVINRSVYNRTGAVVMVGKRDGSNSLEVLYEINNNVSIPQSDNGVLGNLPEHAATHQYPSYDTVFIKNFQFIPLLCLPVTAHTVRVFPGTIAKTYSSGVAYCSGDTSLDLSADVPASGACWEIIQVEDDGTISTVTGPTETDRATVEASDLPTADYKPIWAVVLSSEYSELEASNSRNDFWDLRFASFGGYDASDISYTPADTGDWDYLEDPGQVGDALDQLASRVFVVETAGAGAGPGLVPLEQHTASASASLNFTSWYSALYDEYLFEIIGLRPVTDGVDFYFRMSTDGGSSYLAGTNYSYSTFARDSTGTAVSGSTGAAQIPLRGAARIGNDALYSVNGRLSLFRPGSSDYKHVNSVIDYFSSTTTQIARADAVGALKSATAVNAVQFLFSSGNIGAGTIRVYGVRKS